MDDDRVHAAGEQAVAAVLLCIALAAFGVLVLAVTRVASLERALDFADLLVPGVLAAFGSFCAYLAWRLFRHRPQRAMQRPLSTSTKENAPPARVRRSQVCAAAGVLLLIMSVLVPAHWYPVVLLFLGLALLAVSHALTPCVERMEQLRKARASMRQL